jgi:2,4-dienoyl-CoA reductase-like NADH-dependent reductase (Old Yellow Enzyme family)
MYEHLTSFYGGPPNTDHLGLYAQWARGGWGMTFTGNVQVDRQHLTLGRDMVAPPDLSEGSLLPFKRLSDAMHGREQDGSRSLAVMQLSHGGRQSANFMGGRRLFHPPSAPSAIPVGRDGKTGWLNKILYRGLFTTPRAMDKADIDQVVDAFVRGARMAHLSGFDGVEIHASHGCKPSFTLMSLLF